MKFLSLFGKKKSSRKSSVNTSSSVSSFSSESDASPQTPTYPSDTRGLFRTLEPLWYFHTTLLPGQHEQEWIRFDEASQSRLESDYQTKADASLSESALGPCTVVFKQTVSKKDRRSVLYPMKDRHASMPILPRTQRTLVLNKDVRRTASPVWWYEQDLADGAKGMCRFDPKNQVRLEALSEGRTRLTLHDDAFDIPFTVVLDEPKDRELKEEVRGFLYFQAMPFPSPPQDKLLTQDASYFDAPWETALVRRFSI
ncbi:hypothetical protein BY458DRAFT_511023 [Sporodiniella umbellata]|nr:hypothetical protein BY458DRAFT_511023 [Sporodiniella umbellata]